MKRWPVLLTVHSLGRGGCERDAAKIAVGIDRNLFAPHIAVFHEGGYRVAEVTAAGVPILNLPVRSFMNASVIHGSRILGAYIREHGIRLIHSFDVPLNIFTAPVARFYKVPVVITAQLSYRDMYSRLYRAALKMSDRLSDRVVVNSRAVGQTLLADGLPEEKLYLCYNGVQTSEFHPGEGRRPDGWQDALVVGSICVMREEKRIEWLMRSFAEVRDQAPGLRLLLMGDGPESAHLAEVRDTLGLGDVCHFQPGSPEVAGWMRGIDIYVNCSRSESFPNGLLEAMASGCCVIGSNVGGIPELVSHGKDGLIFEARDRSDLTKQLSLAIGDAALRDAMRREAAITARERFSMVITLERTESLYRGLLEEHDP